METIKNYILSKEAAEKKLRRMALEVTERNFGEEQLILAGIKENGVIIEIVNLQGARRYDNSAAISWLPVCKAAQRTV